MRIFIHKANMVDNNEQSKSNQIETITQQTKTLDALLKLIYY